MIVGIEGPVLAGKSSLVRSVARCMTDEGYDCGAAPCYVEMARRLRRDIPPGMPHSVAEQLSAMRFFLEVDRLRRPAGEVGLLLLDRTAWTLLAHLHALNTIGAFDDGPARTDSSTSEAIQALMPDKVIYLDVPWKTQLARSTSRTELPRPFLDQGFNAAFRQYFERTIELHHALWLDATRPLERTSEIVVDYLRSTYPEPSHGPVGTTELCDNAIPGTGYSPSFRR